MSPAEFFAIALLGCALGLMLVAVMTDIATMTIPNWVSIVAAVAFVPAGFAAGLSPTEVGLHVGCGLLVFAIGFALFNFGYIGGGDVKLIAALSIWTGFAALWSFLSATVIAGGVLAIAALMIRKRMAPHEARPAFFNRLLDPQRGIPYAIAIAIGAFVSAINWPVSVAVVIPT